MNAQLIAFIIAFMKAAPALSRFMETLVKAWVAHKLEENKQDEADKQRRDDAAIDAAVGKLPKCPTCGNPYIPSRPHKASDGASTVPTSGGNST